MAPCPQAWVCLGAPRLTACETRVAGGGIHPPARAPRCEMSGDGPSSQRALGPCVPCSAVSSVLTARQALASNLHNASPSIYFPPHHPVQAVRGHRRGRRAHSRWGNSEDGGVQAWWPGSGRASPPGPQPPSLRSPGAMGSMGSQRLKEPGAAGRPGRSVVTSFSFDRCQLEEEAAAGAARGRDGAARGTPILTDSEGRAPDDRYHAIYFAMLLAGVGFLLPYNSFITDVDYLHHKFPGTSIVFDMSLTYILVALVAVLLNNALVERLSLHTRITAGYLLALGPLLFISICDVWLQLFSRDQAYAINLAAVGTVAFGCTVQQSSFYGYTGMLPKRYTQGVMTGESTAGVMVSLSRIVTKLLLRGERASTLIFFLVSAGLELLCFLLHLLVRRSRFVRHHTVRPRDGHAGPRGYRVHHDVAAGDVCFENQGPALTSSGSPKDSPVHEATAGDRGAYTRFDVPPARVERSWPSFRALLLHRYVVARAIWADMLSIAVTYFITLCLFPGLESEIRHCVLGEWLPILVMAVFNLSDFVGKRRARPAPPGLALRLLPAHGHQQRLLRQRAHDPGRRQGGAPAAGAGREHHDRVLHDGADAGLGSGLLHLQPHPGRPQRLPRDLRHQRLPPRRPLSRGQPCPCPCLRARPPPVPTPPTAWAHPGSRQGLGAATLDAEPGLAHTVPCASHRSPRRCAQCSASLSRPPGRAVTSQHPSWRPHPQVSSEGPPPSPQSQHHRPRASPSPGPSAPSLSPGFPGPQDCWEDQDLRV